MRRRAWGLTVCDLRHLLVEEVEAAEQFWREEGFLAELCLHRLGNPLADCVHDFFAVVVDVVREENHALHDAEDRLLRRELVENELELLLVVVDVVLRALRVPLLRKVEKLQFFSRVVLHDV